MNTNELADYLDKYALARSVPEQKYIEQAATMLRQLQAEIGALKAENQFFKDIMCDIEILRKAQE